MSFLSYFGGYKSPRNITLLQYAWAIFRSTSIAVGVLLTLLFFLEIQYVSRLVMVIFAVAEFFVLTCSRAVVLWDFKNSVQSGEKALRVIIIGTRARASELSRELKKRIDYGVQIIGFIDPDPACTEGDEECTPILATIDNISECLKKNVVDEVIVAIPRSMLEDVEPIVIACEEEGITLRFMANVFNVQVARMSLAHVGRIPLLTMEPISHDEGQIICQTRFRLCIDGDCPAISDAAVPARRPCHQDRLAGSGSLHSAAGWAAKASFPDVQVSVDACRCRGTIGRDRASQRGGRSRSSR